MLRHLLSDQASSSTSISSSCGHPAAEAIGASSAHLASAGTRVLVVVVVGATVVVVVVVVVATSGVVVVVGGIVGKASCVLTCPLQPTSTAAAIVRVSLRNSLLLDRG